MKYQSLAILVGIASIISSSMCAAASVSETEYMPQKVVYDVNTETIEGLDSVLSRASYLSTITGADPFEQSIVLVSHGPEIAFFATRNRDKYRDIMQRVQSLVDSEVITIRMCKVAAESFGYKPEDINDFVEMIPMGDAEIIRLQNEEDHAYMR